MTHYFITRHPGAKDWAKRQNIAIDQWLSHLDTSQVKAGDCVFGNLPIHHAAEICAKGAHYYHLSLDTSAESRGKELSADDMQALGARLQLFYISEY